MEKNSTRDSAHKPLFMHFKNACHKFMARIPKSELRDVALPFPMFLLFALCIFINDALSSRLH